MRDPIQHWCSLSGNTFRKTCPYEPEPLTKDHPLVQYLFHMCVVWSMVEDKQGSCRRPQDHADGLI